MTDGGLQKIFFSLTAVFGSYPIRQTTIGVVGGHKKDVAAPLRQRKTPTLHQGASSPDLPFGKADVTIGTMVNNLRFAGQYYDQETGLHYNYHRYYDPKLGRYLKPDPSHSLNPEEKELPYLIPFLLKVPQEYNKFVYVKNNPISFIDPFGLEPTRKWDSCNGEEFKECERRCADKGGVKKCTVQLDRKPKCTVNRNGTVLTKYVWVRRPPNCTCNRDDGSPSNPPIPVIPPFMPGGGGGKSECVFNPWLPQCTPIY